MFLIESFEELVLIFLLPYTPNSYFTCNGRANSERNAAEAEQEADGLTSTSLATEVKGNGTQQADEAAIKYTHAQYNQL